MVFGEGQLQNVWDQVLAVADRQQGFVTSVQASRVGVSRWSLEEFTTSGRLWEPGWSVLQVSDSALAPRYAYPYAAWLAVAPEEFVWERPSATHEDAVLSHESACQLWGLGSAPAITVLSTPRPLTPQPGIELRIASGMEALTPDAVTVHHGVPVTTPRRTIADLVRGWTDHDLVRRALTDAVRRDLVDLGEVYGDLVPLADEYSFPATGPEFAGRFVGELETGSLSDRNQRALTALAGSR